jgi:hypothetical protein
MISLSKLNAKGVTYPNKNFVTSLIKTPVIE